MLKELTLEAIYWAYWKDPYGNCKNIFNDGKPPNSKEKDMGDRKRTVAAIATNPALRPVLRIIDYALEICKELGLCSDEHVALAPVQVVTGSDISYLYHLCRLWFVRMLGVRNRDYTVISRRRV